MTEKARFRAAQINPVLLINPSTRRIHIRLDSVLGSLGLPLSCMPELVHSWRDQVLVEADAEGEGDHLYLPLLMLPEFLDGMPAWLLSHEGKDVADEYQRLIRAMQFSSLLITQLRKSGFQIDMGNIPEGISAQDIQGIATFIAEQPSKRISGYQCSPVDCTFNFNGRQV